MEVIIMVLLLIIVVLGFCLYKAEQDCDDLSYELLKMERQMRFLELMYQDKITDIKGVKNGK